MFKNTPPFVKNDQLGHSINTNNVVGPIGNIVQSDFGKNFTNVYQHEWEFAVPASEIMSALTDIREHLRATGTCLPLIGIYLRFAHVDDETLIAHSVASGSFKNGDPIEFIDISIYDPKGLSSEMQRKYDAAFQELTRFLMVDHGARLHWGKNADWMFKFQKRLGSFGYQMDRFKKVVQRIDPEGMFSNEFSEQLGF